MDVQTTNLQQLCDAFMTILTKVSEECFKHLVESMPRRIKAVLKVKGRIFHWLTVEMFFIVHFVKTGFEYYRNDKIDFFIRFFTLHFPFIASSI